MSATMVRLISDTGRRIWTPKEGDPSLDTNGRILKRQRDEMTERNLITAGWKPYSGPAVTDSKGYVVAGSDPAITVKPPTVSPRREWMS